MSEGARRSAGVIMAVLVLMVDQASKYWVLYGLDLPARGVVRVLPVLNFAMVWNHGVTFGILAGDNATALLIAIAAVAIIALSVWLWRATTLVTTLATGAIIGGAIGNVVSRLRYGAVVDFIDAHVGAYHWFVFNLADAAIVCGVAALIGETMLHKEAPLLGNPRSDKEAS